MGKKFNQACDKETRYKKKFDLAELALTLELLPIALLILKSFISGLGGYVILLTLIFMVAGFVLGIAALFQAKYTIEKNGKAAAILAIAIPVVIVGAPLVIYIGAVTGLISLM